MNGDLDQRARDFAAGLKTGQGLVDLQVDLGVDAGHGAVASFVGYLMRGVPEEELTPEWTGEAVAAFTRAAQEMNDRGGI